MKGHKTWNKGQEGLQEAWNKGIPWSEKIKSEMSKKLKGRTLNTGRTHFKKGQVPWNKGTPMPEEIKQKLREDRIGRTLNTGRTHFKKGQMAGENNPKWKGGITSQNKIIRSSPDYGRWRKSVYKKDWFSCQFCGYKGKNIEAHHVKNWSKNKNLRFNINNGLTLCNKCHLKIRKKESFYEPLCKNLVLLKNNPMYVKNILKGEHNFG